MTIEEIKSQLLIRSVLTHYHLTLDCNNRLKCPFHDDRVPSLQVYEKTNTCYCFSTNCKTNGKSMDVIDFIMYMKGITKHEAIEKAKSLIQGNQPAAIKKDLFNQPNDLSAVVDEERIALLEKLFTYFKSAVYNSNPAREYVQKRTLDLTKTEIGYNSGQFHHRKPRDMEGNGKKEKLITACVKYGVLLDKGMTSRTGEKAYSSFGKYALVFPLKNIDGKIISLYYRSIHDKKGTCHFYLKDRKGLYPGYPNRETTHLILTESIIDAATLKQYLPAGQAGADYKTLALYGTNGLTEEHTEAMNQLNKLEEIIFFFDGDAAGETAIKKYTEAIKIKYPTIKLSAVKTPQGEDINSLAAAAGLTVNRPDAAGALFTQLIKDRKTISSNLHFSNERKNRVTPSGSEPGGAKDGIRTRTNGLNTTKPYNITYTGLVAHYSIKGGIMKNGYDTLKVTLVVEHKTTRRKSRNKLDLYEDRQVEKVSKEVANRLELSPDEIEKDIHRMTDLLEIYRDEEKEKQESKKPKTHVMTIPERNKALAFLKKPKLIDRLNKLIGKYGVVGEEKNRIFLLCIAAAHKMPQTLHALVQGSSGSGKTHLIKLITLLMPPENVIRLTRVTEGSFYNYGEYELVGKLIVIEDYDGLKEEAEYAFRELQSNEELISSTSSTDKSNGEVRALIKHVRGPIGSLAATTRIEIYEDNLSRCFVLAVDESKAQTMRIIRHQNGEAAGTIDKEEREKIKVFIRNCIRLLKPLEVINPYANKLHLPEEAFKIRRLNANFQAFIKQVTRMNQYQRTTDRKGRLITEKEDVATAIDIMFDSIILKVDELDGSVRLFYEQLKNYISQEDRDKDFTQREIRHALRISKSQLQRYINELVQLEYIRSKGGYANKGYRYQITYWDDIEQMRNRIKTYLYDQLNKL